MQVNPPVVALSLILPKLIVSSDSITRCTGTASQQGDEPEPCEGSRHSRVVAWDDRKTAQPASRAVSSSQSHAPASLSADRLTLSHVSAGPLRLCKARTTRWR